MKKLIVLTGIAVLMAAAGGCEHLQLFRGARASSNGVCCGDPMPVCTSGCDTCGGGGACGGPVIGAPMVAPGPAPDGYAQ
jgi:hypothetical protein